MSGTAPSDERSVDIERARLAQERYLKDKAKRFAALALSLTVTACGAANEDGGDDTTSANEDTSLSGQLAGAGASSQEKAQ